MIHSQSEVNTRRITLLLHVGVILSLTALFLPGYFVDKLTDVPASYSMMVLGIAAALQTILVFRRAGSREDALVLLLLLFFLAFGLPVHRYVQLNNMSHILAAAAMVGILAVAEIVVILSGGIDISVGAILAVSAAIIGASVGAGVPVPVGITMGLVSGIVLGAINGGLVAYVGIPPIIVTLATLFAFRGGIDLACNFTGIVSITRPTEQLGMLVPMPDRPLNPHVVLFILAAVVTAVFLAYTRMGRAIYAVGDNPAAAETSGVKTRRVRVFVYIASGFLSAVAGLVYAVYNANITRDAGESEEFYAIGAVVLGGANLFGGSGKVRGAVIGAIMIYAIANATDMAGIHANWEDASIGLLILLAVAMNVATRRKETDATG
jgi:ribose/xylose/arabinose/galactoside ABC-type transport system permease subunit